MIKFSLAHRNQSKPLQFQQAENNKNEDSDPFNPPKNKNKYIISSKKSKNNYTELRKKIFSFRNMEPDDTFEEVPSKDACDYATQAIEHMNDYKIYPNLMTCSKDGGIIIEFLKDNHYFLIEFHNSGEIVYFYRDKNGNETVHECMMTKLLSLFQKEILILFTEV